MNTQQPAGSNDNSTLEDDDENSNLHQHLENDVTAQRIASELELESTDAQINVAMY